MGYFTSLPADYIVLSEMSMQGFNLFDIPARFDKSRINVAFQLAGTAGIPLIKLHCRLNNG